MTWESEQEVTPADRRRAEADRLRGELLRGQVVRVPPPRLRPSDGVVAVDDGCMMCGVAAVEMPADAMTGEPVEYLASGPGRLLGETEVAEQVTGGMFVGDVPVRRLAVIEWRLHVCAPSTVGVRPRRGDVGRKIVGHSCPACAEALDLEGGDWRRAVTFLLGADAANVEVTTLSGVTWASVVVAARRRAEPDPEPNDVPFEHVRLEAPDVDDDAPGSVERVRLRGRLSGDLLDEWPDAQ